MRRPSPEPVGTLLKRSGGFFVKIGDASDFMARLYSALGPGLELPELLVEPLVMLRREMEKIDLSSATQQDRDLLAGALRWRLLIALAADGAFFFRVHTAFVGAGFAFFLGFVTAGTRAVFLIRSRLFLFGRMNVDGGEHGSNGEEA